MRVLAALVLAGCGVARHDYGGHFHIELARDDANHSAVVEYVLHDPAEVAFAVLGDDDGAAEYAPDGFFTFTVHGDAYRLLVTVNGYEVEYQHHADFLEICDRQAGRRHPAPVSAGTAIEFATRAPAPPLAAGATVIVASTGVWTATDTQQADVALSLPWTQARPVDSELGLLGGDDRVYLYAFEPCAACSEPYRSLTRVLDASIVQRDGETATVSESLRVPSERLDVAATIPRAGELARVAAAFPDLQGMASWGIDSIPSLSLGPIGRLPLVAAGEGTTDVAITVPVANVFAGTTSVGWLETHFVRELAPGIPLVHGTRHVAPVDQAQLAIAGTIGVPERPTIAGVPDGDAGELVLGADDPVVTWRTTVDGPIDDHVVTLFELAATGPIARRTIVTDRQRATLDRALFVPGRRYIIRLEARLGVPGASTGFFLTTSYPFATATTWSAVMGTVSI